MITFSDCPREITMKESDRCLDPQLWHACAGGMVQMPAVSSLVCYFPQGQAEHAQGPVDFPNCPRIPPYILCRVAGVKYLADPETDEVYAKMKLMPVRSEELDYGGGEDFGGLGSNGSGVPEKTTSFAKTLTQSDANNGGGFSVPRYCAETIFPRLDYSADPPVQTILAKDVHGEIWKFRHIYRGTPRRHLLTTGWSTFVNQKKLVAGDSIVFLRTENGELCVGIRRAKRGPGGGLELPSGWNIPGGNCLPPPYAGFSLFLREQENKLMRRNGENPGSVGGMIARGRVRPESVVEAANLAADGQLFEVVYYPRASTPEFCVKAAAVRAALRIDWCPGMRFKMAFETEDSSRISWFMGTVSSVQCADPVRWPDSPWRLLQVTWDEPDLLQNVKRVSPWLVELVTNMPAIHLKTFSPSRKKLRLPPSPDFAIDGRFLTHVFSGNSFEPSSNPSAAFRTAPLQGYREPGILNLVYPSQISTSASCRRVCSTLDFTGWRIPPARRRAPSPPPLAAPPPGAPYRTSPACSPSGTPLRPARGSRSVRRRRTFCSFGQPILTEQQTPPSSGDSGGGSPEFTRKSSDLLNGSGSAINLRGLAENSPSEGGGGLVWYKDHLHHHHHYQSATESETGHCKVFLESENVGRTLDLSVLGSYEELYRRLADIDFMKTARRLQILMDAGSDNVGR
ncbi:unnamed protein product [Spirodela intermedia]|uniref:Auxin response factor n=1 Tax=Spirodela intermedia TaxID=51605 RepID=A0A7I8ICY9_SPIIN|nr:unnamed protein product [Spirodela intermedia]CAA6655255.1 unnamed protein product [Spirodela intermedia]